MARPSELIERRLEPFSQGDPVVGSWLRSTIGRIMERDGFSDDQILDVAEDDIRHVADWFVAALAAGLPWTRKLGANGVPIKLMKFGTIEAVVREADRATVVMSQKGHDVVLVHGDEKVVAALDEGAIIVQLLTPAALDREGAAMGHCIGGGSYDRSLKKGALYLSVRDRRNRPIRRQRRSDAPPTAQKPIPDAIRNGSASRRDLHLGLSKVKRLVLAQIGSGKAPKKMTVAWVLREAGRGRSQFYKNHGAFERRIDLVQRAVIRLLDIRNGRRRTRPTMTSLSEDNRRLRTRVRELEAVETSKLASLLFVHAYPRDVSLLTAENGALKAEVDRCRGEIESLRSYVRSLGRHVQIPAMKDGNVTAFPGLGGDGD